MKPISVTSHDGQPFTAWSWSAQHPKATVHIVHGMAEHCLRYQAFAAYLQNAGFNVITHNHRGHGERTPLGHYADREQGRDCGWSNVITDMLTVQQLADPGIPLFVLGHSMGSFIAQGYAIRYGDKLSGLILSGSNHQRPLEFYAARWLAKLLRLLQGERHPSALLDRLSFGSFNKAFQPTRTAFDWLSSDPQQVDAYLNDPLCGQLCSNQLWIDLLGGLIEISSEKELARIPANLPIYLFGGDQDPVGRMGKGLPALAQALKRSGHEKVLMKLYAGGRHEMLNELHCEAVFADTLQWIQSQLTQQG
ncbi:MAG: alpha/beta hydrolase [Bacterioplanes sp.]|nr:alpha/beta hydrolase [Bacterioplanes sp.]